MASIIDDFTPIYNAIVNPIIQNKKLACTDTNIEDVGSDSVEYNCEDVYNINEKDIQKILENSNNIETTTYKNKIKNSAIYFKNNYIDDDKFNQNLEIENKINALRKTRDDYETMYALMQAMQVLFLLYLGYVFFVSPYGKKWAENETAKKQAEKKQSNGGALKQRIGNAAYGAKRRVGNAAYDVKTKVGETRRYISTGKARKDTQNLIYRGIVNLEKENPGRTLWLQTYVFNGISVIPLVWFVFSLIINIFKNRRDDLNKEIDSLNKFENGEDMSNLINDIIQIANANYNTETETEDSVYSSFVNHYIELRKNSLVNNNYTKNEKIKSMNEIFTELKSIAYVNDNKFNDIIVDNYYQVECLMKLITHEGDAQINECGNANLICNLIKECGFYGLKNSLDDENIDEFENGLSLIEMEDIQEFYNNMQNNVFNSTVETAIINSPVFKVINNIFILRIKYYGIKKVQFIKYIYKYFDNNNNYGINKTDLVNNYKSLINIIYQNYNIYSNINERNNFKGTNMITKYRFTEIINKFSTDEIFNLMTYLDKTINEIEEFKKIYKNDILKDIDDLKDQNKNLMNFFIVLFISSLSKSTSLSFNIVVEDNNNPTIMVLKILTIFVLALLANSLVYSYWQKNSIDNNFKESIILDSNNKFSMKLRDLYSSLNHLYNIKNNNVDKLYEVFNKNSIKMKRNGDITLYSKYNSVDNYTILDVNDVTNMIIDDIYTNLNQTMKIYECCTFLQDKKKKKVVLPYHEIVLNLIYIGITGIVLLYILSDDKINPKKLFEKIFEKKSLNQNGKGQSGGEIYIGEKLKENSIGNIEYVIYVAIIYMSIKFTTLLYNANVDYEKSLYQ